MSSRSYFQSRGLSQDAAKAEALLYRYPNISEEELASLIRTFSHFPLLDFGLLAADERLGAKLEAFYADHAEKLRPPLTLIEWMIGIGAVVGLLVLIYNALG